MVSQPLFYGLIRNKKKHRPSVCIATDIHGAELFISAVRERFLGFGIVRNLAIIKGKVMKMFS